MLYIKKSLLTLILIACALTASVASSYAADARAFNGATEVKGAVVTTLKGSGESKLTIGSVLAITCTELGGTGSEVFPTVHFVFTFKYGGCKAKVSGVSTAATVASSGCSQLLDITITVGLSCGTGSVVITAGSLCTIKIPTQEALKGITYKPLETKSATIEGAAAVTGMSQTNNCSITGAVEYKGLVVITPEPGVTLEIK